MSSFPHFLVALLEWRHSWLSTQSNLNVAFPLVYLQRAFCVFSWTTCTWTLSSSSCQIVLFRFAAKRSYSSHMPNAAWYMSKTMTSKAESKLQSRLCWKQGFLMTSKPLGLFYPALKSVYFQLSEISRVSAVTNLAQ